MTRRESDKNRPLSNRLWRGAAAVGRRVPDAAAGWSAGYRAGIGTLRWRGGRPTRGPDPGNQEDTPRGTAHRRSAGLSTCIVDISNHVFEENVNSCYLSKRLAPPPVPLPTARQNAALNLNDKVASVCMSCRGRVVVLGQAGIENVCRFVTYLVMSPIPVSFYFRIGYFTHFS
ncbi:unnamed protein product [Nezara viridula]|uniref:Uncharacterized protein n=1 Tax=Nezara viridula TaxID=85310 RepID=A0A9P0MQ42_NEZVI|nr:unnamed protein product [Nezara viridula]